MAKSQAPDNTAQPLPVIAPESLPSVNSFESVLAEYGVTAAQSYIPQPPTAVKSNLRELCVFTTEVKDERGETIKNVKGHTGPMMFLEKQAEYDGARFEGYDGFYVYVLLHPKKGKTIVTVGRPTGEKLPPVVRFFDSLKAGAWVQIAEIGTSKGYGVYQPIPVQR
jgi:hypothetical protein